MKTLEHIPEGTTITVKKISGSRTVFQKLERLGIIPGADLKIIRKDTDGITVYNSRKEVYLTKEYLPHIIPMEHFTRQNDPILLSGCCASGNTDEIMRRIENCYQK